MHRTNPARHLPPASSVRWIGRDTADPPGGQILRDEAGEATGMLIDTAMELVYRHVAPATDEQLAHLRARVAVEDA